MNKIFLFPAIFICTFSSCKKDNKKSYAAASIIDSFPLSSGLAWKFHTHAHFDSANIIAHDYYFNSFWKVDSDTLINGITSTKISQLDSSYTGITDLSYSYYANKPNGFYGIAVRNSGSMFFLKTTELFNNTKMSLLNSWGINNSSIDSIFVPDTSLYLMKFPVVINDSWHSFEYGRGAYILRKWLGDTIINTSAGTFSCKKMQVIFDNNHDAQPDSLSPIVYQFFSSKGLIVETRTSSLVFSGGGTGTLNQITKLVQVSF